MKEAYEFLSTGVSSTGIFYKQKRQVKPAPPPPAPKYQPPNPYLNKTFTVPIEIRDFFYGKPILIPRTDLVFYINYADPILLVPIDIIAAQRNQSGRTRVRIQLQIVDSSNFYKVSGDGRDTPVIVSCKIKASSAEILAGKPISIRNLNQGLPDIKVTLDNQKCVIPQAGLPGKNGIRGPLNVEIDPVHKKLEDDNYHVLLNLKEKLDETIKNYTNRFTRGPTL